MADIAIGVPIPRGVVHFENGLPHASAPKQADDGGDPLAELISVGWNLALLPVLTWSSFAAVSALAWHSWLAPVGCVNTRPDGSANPSGTFALAHD